MQAHIKPILFTLNSHQAFTSCCGWSLTWCRCRDSTDLMAIAMSMEVSRSLENSLHTASSVSSEGLELSYEYSSSSSCIPMWANGY